MAIVRISGWVMLFGHEDRDNMRALFKDFFALLPLSQTELAKALRVEQPTVSRWAAGKSVPELKLMQRVVEVVEARMAEIQEQMQLMRQVVNAAQDFAAGLRLGGVARRKTGSLGRKKVTKLLRKQSRRRRRPRQKAP